MPRKPSAWATRWARRISSTVKAWGVCTARRVARSGVATTCQSSLTCLMVSTAGMAAMPVPVLSTASMQRRMVASSTRQRAPSWMSTLLASAGRACRPFHTESCRVAPPETMFTRSCISPEASRAACMAFLSSSRATTTMPSATAVKALAARQMTGSPWSSSSTLFLPAPIREPLPPAKRITYHMGTPSCQLRSAATPSSSCRMRYISAAPSLRTVSATARIS